MLGALSERIDFLLGALGDGARGSKQKDRLFTRRTRCIARLFTRYSQWITC